MCVLSCRRNFYEDKVLSAYTKFFSTCVLSMRKMGG